MLKVGVLGSTRGTDLQAIINAIEGGTLEGVEISLVLSNRKDAGILERASRHGLETIFLSPKNLDREAYDRRVDAEMKSRGVELILLIGYMKLMSEWFVNAWRNRAMNIHPSLLPAFAGGMDLNVHREVILRGCKVSGATLIYIDEGADTGPIIDQGVVRIDKDETIDSLKEKVQRVEGELLVKALANFRDGGLRTVRGLTVF